MTEKLNLITELVKKGDFKTAMVLLIEVNVGMAESIDTLSNEVIRLKDALNRRGGTGGETQNRSGSGFSIG